MAHNHEAGGSGVGDRPLSLNIEEASILLENNCDTGMEAPAWMDDIGGWIGSASHSARGAGDGGLHRTLVASSTDVAAQLAAAVPGEDWRNAVAEFDIGAPTHTCYNIASRRAWWRGRNIKVVLHEYGYMPEYRRFAPPRAATWLCNHNCSIFF
jgi:hypothetical protein